MQCLILDWILDWRENAIKDSTGSTDKFEFKQLIRQKCCIRVKFTDVGNYTVLLWLC